MDNLFKESAVYHTNLARQAARTGNSPRAGKAFYIAVSAWKKAVEIHPSFMNYLIAAEREYLHYIQTDRVYPEILGNIRKAISARPGILREEIYGVLDRYHRIDLDNVLFLAERNGHIEKRKKGSDWELRLPHHQPDHSVWGLAGKLRQEFSFVSARNPRNPR
jgi:septum formation topological specificity factor MinE